MNVAEEIEALSTKVEGLQKQQSVAEGRFQVAKEALESAGFETVETAQEWLAKETKRLDKAEEELKNDISEFKSTYSVYLEATG